MTADQSDGRTFPPEFSERSPRLEQGRFHNLNALVTGVSKDDGIGAAICRGLAREGVSGILSTAQPKSAEHGLTLAQSFQQLGAQDSHWFGADLTTEEGILSLVRAGQELFEMPIENDRDKKTPGKIQLLFLNAGAAFDEPFERMKWESLDKTLLLNLISPMMLLRYAVSEGLLEKGNAQVVVNGSFVGQFGQEGQAAYAAAKAGLDGFVKSAAQEFGKHGITINAVHPGYIENSMTAGIPNVFRQAYLDTTPVRRLGTPDDVAHAMLFFADPRSRFITGQSLIIDGGLGNPGAVKRAIDGNQYMRMNDSQERTALNRFRRERDKPKP